MVDRRNLLKLGLAAPALLTLPAAARRSRRSDRPNLIHICTDDMRYDDISLMPNAKRLFRRAGVDFTRHIVPFSVCAPSRASILTGLQPHNHGVLTNHGSGGYKAYRHLEDNALPVWLTDAGYYVGHVGKFINNYGKYAPTHIPPGYADWHAMADEKPDYFNFTLNENGTLVDYDNGEYATDVFARIALEFLASAPEPYVLFLWPNAPHLPATPAPQDVGTFGNVDMPIYPNFNEADVSDKPELIRDLPLLTDDEIAALQDTWRSRAECLQCVDRCLASIIDALTTSGQIDNTHVILTSDNGLLLGEHRVADTKNLIYEESTKVPLLWRGPGVERGTRANPVSNIDVTAALVELAGATAGRTLDGTSLLPLLANAKAPWNTATLLQCVTTIGLATQHYRYGYWPKTNEFELYDLTRDPYELQNVAGVAEYAKIQSDLANTLALLEGCAGDTCQWTGKFPHPPKG